MNDLNQCDALLSPIEVQKLRQYLIDEELSEIGFRELTAEDGAYLSIFFELVKNSYGLDGYVVDDYCLSAACKMYFRSRKDPQNVYPAFDFWSILRRYLFSLKPDCAFNQELFEYILIHKSMIGTLLSQVSIEVVWKILLVFNDIDAHESFLNVKSDISEVLKKYCVSANNFKNKVYKEDINETFVRAYLSLVDKIKGIHDYRCACNAILFRECLYYDISPIIIHYENKDEFDAIIEGKSCDRVAKLVDLFKKEQKATAKFLKSL